MWYNAISFLYAFARLCLILLTVCSICTSEKIDSVRSYLRKRRLACCIHCDCEPPPPMPRWLLVITLIVMPLSYFQP